MDLINQLRDSKERTLAYFNLASFQLDLQYGPDKWSIQQILHHLADAEAVLHVRLKRAIVEPSVVVWGFDQDAWCIELDYQGVDLDNSKSLYSSMREQNIALIEKYFDSHGHLEFVHSGQGKRTVKQEMEKVHDHNARHLEQINRALQLSHGQ